VRQRDAKGRFITVPDEPEQADLPERAEPTVELVSVDDVFTPPSVEVLDIRGQDVDQSGFDAWDDESLVILKESKNIGHKASGRWYLMAYDASTANPGGMLCNRINAVGDAICRLRRDHWPHPHIPFHVTLVVQSGIYVDQIGPDPTLPMPPVREESPVGQ